MTNLTVELDDSQAQALREMARKYGLEPEQFVMASIEDLLAHPDVEFDAAARRVLSKNEELYRRLS
jgi:predicted transcriptional regulator